MIFRNEKRGIVTITVLSLLMLVSVILFISLYVYFDMEINDFLVFTKQEGFQRDVSIVSISGDKLYVQNDFGYFIDVTSIKVSGTECLSSPTVIYEGYQEVDLINTCTDGLLLNESFEVVLTSNFGVLAEYEVLI